jgi:hypothetical protein
MVDSYSSVVAMADSAIARSPGFARKAGAANTGRGTDACPRVLTGAEGAVIELVECNEIGCTARAGAGPPHPRPAPAGRVWVVSPQRPVSRPSLAEFSIAESDARLGTAGPVDGRPRWGMRVCAKTSIVRPQVRRIDLQPEPIGTRSGWPALSNTLTDTKRAAMRASSELSESPPSQPLSSETSRPLTPPPAPGDHDQRLDERDQALSKQDQALSNRDQTLSDQDEQTMGHDQELSDTDSRAAAHGGASEFLRYQISATRQRNTNSRQTTALDRAQIAEERDGIADERDQIADERDRITGDRENQPADTTAGAPMRTHAVPSSRGSLPRPE